MGSICLNLQAILCMKIYYMNHCKRMKEFRSPVTPSILILVWNTPNPARTWALSLLPIQPFYNYEYIQRKGSKTYSFIGHDRMTRPKYIAAQRNMKDITPLQENFSVKTRGYTRRVDCMYEYDFFSCFGNLPNEPPSNTVARARANLGKFLSIAWVNSSGY